MPAFCQRGISSALWPSPTTDQNDLSMEPASSLCPDNLAGCNRAELMADITTALRIKSLLSRSGKTPINKSTLSKTDNLGLPDLWQFAFHMVLLRRSEGLLKEFELHGRFYGGLYNHRPLHVALPGRSSEASKAVSRSTPGGHCHGDSVFTESPTPTCM